MKNFLFIVLLLLGTLGTIAQTKNKQFGVSAGAYIQHYNGNLGNSFFQFNTACFGGGAVNIGIYLNKSFDANATFSIGDFGYCQTDADKTRIVSIEYRCPGCTDQLGMGQLRSRMVAGNVALTYKLANGYLLKETSKIAPYLYGGMGINRLTDNMGRNCVNVGNHFTLNAGAGIKYNFNERFNIGYNMAFGCFMTKKVYYTNTEAGNADADVFADDHSEEGHAEELKMEKRKDFYMQNMLSFGINF
jgi:OmpA-OmpF porin, OOP family